MLNDFALAMLQTWLRTQQLNSLHSTILGKKLNKGEEITIRIADPEIMPDDPSFTGSQQNDVVSSSHAGNYAPTLCGISL